MGDLLKTFTYPRNAFGATAAKSAEKASEVIERADLGQLKVSPSGELKDEAFNDSRLFLATVSGSPREPLVTPVGRRFQELSALSPEGAWRWLLTRSLWLYSVPNGSNASVNAPAQHLPHGKNFFDWMIRLAVHFSALPSPANDIYFDELLPVLDDDSKWVLSSDDLFREVLKSRGERGGVLTLPEHAELLTDLEPGYEVGRDYLNTVFRKAFGQSGLFSLVGTEGRVVGFRLDPSTYSNAILAERLRFVLDNPRVYMPGKEVS